MKKVKLVVAAAFVAACSAYANAVENPGYPFFWNPIYNSASEVVGCESSRYNEVTSSMNEWWTVPDMQDGGALVAYSGGNVARTFYCTDGELWTDGYGDWHYL